MCLILLAYDAHPHYSLVLAANRDEFYRRPTSPLDYWDDNGNILAGRDLEAGGTWLGMDRNGRWSALTNFRRPATPITDAPSRGDLVRGFLSGSDLPGAYLQRVRTVGRRYNGFNLLAGDRQDLFYYSNQGHDIHRMRPGIHGISTCLLGTKWPKIRKGEDRLAACVSDREDIDLEEVFGILEDRSFPADEEIPRTGLDRNWERILSPLFIESDAYGTRSSSVLLVRRTGEVTFAERTFGKSGSGSQGIETRRFDFLMT